MRYIILAFIWWFISLTSCKKEDFTSWDTHVIAPLAESSIGIGNILPDSASLIYMQDGIHLRYSTILNLIDSDSIFKIPDTTFIESYKSPFPIPIKFPAGFPIDSINNLVKFNFDEARITGLEIESGSSIISVENLIEDDVFFDFKVPKAFLNNTYLSFTGIKADSGKPEKPGKFEVKTDLKDYKLDLRGDNGSEFNRLRTIITARLNPNGKGAIIPPGKPLIRYSSAFQNLVPYCARGYLGSPEFNASENIESGFLKNLSGNILLKDIRMELTAENGIGADLNLKINQLSAVKSSTGKSIILDHELTRNAQQITRAIESDPPLSPFKPTIKKFLLNSTNSNIKEFFELLPDRIFYDADIKVNPLGNISSGNDFIYKTSNIKVRMDIDIPLNISFQNLSFSDTIASDGIASESSEAIQTGEIKILADNGFPLDMNVEVRLLDENKNLLDSFFADDIISAAPVNETLEVIKPTRSILKIPFDNILRSHLANTRFIVINAKVNSSPSEKLLPLLASYKLNLKVIGNGIYRIKLK